MSKQSCGTNMGHGVSCTPDYQCDSCAQVDKQADRIEELEAQLAEKRLQHSPQWRLSAEFLAPQQKVAELKAQLAEQRPYLRHKRSCAKTDSFRVATYCTCGLQAILEKDDE